MSRGEAKKRRTHFEKKVASQGAVSDSSAASVDNPKLAALLRAHFTKKGRAARIARAREALEEARWNTGLDLETIIWIAEDPDIEYM